MIRLLALVVSIVRSRRRSDVVGGCVVFPVSQATPSPVLFFLSWRLC